MTFRLPDVLERYAGDFLAENARMQLTEAIVRHCAQVCITVQKDQLKRSVADWNNGPDTAEICAEEIRRLYGIEP